MLPFSLPLAPSLINKTSCEQGLHGLSVSHLTWDSLDLTQCAKVHLLPHHNRIVENSKRENNGDNNESTRVIRGMMMSSWGKGLAAGREALEMDQAWEFRVWEE